MTVEPPATIAAAGDEPAEDPDGDEAEPVAAGDSAVDETAVDPAGGVDPAGDEAEPVAADVTMADGTAPGDTSADSLAGAPDAAAAEAVTTDETADETDPQTLAPTAPEGAPDAEQGPAEAEQTTTVAEPVESPEPVASGTPASAAEPPEGVAVAAEAPGSALTADAAPSWADSDTGMVALPDSADDLGARATAQRRQRRQTWTFLAMFGLVLAAGAFGYASWTGLLTLPAVGTHAPPVPCPTVVPTAAAAQDVTLNVLNATGRRGLALSVSHQMSARGFRIRAIGNGSTIRAGRPAAVVRYGPTGLLMARTVAAQVRGTVVMTNDKRQNATVDLVLQPSFRALNTKAQAAKLLAPPPVPSPKGCVPAAG